MKEEEEIPTHTQTGRRVVGGDDAVVVVVVL